MSVNVARASMVLTCALFLISPLVNGCSEKKEVDPAKTPKLAPRRWDVGDELINHPLPPEVSDGYLEFAKAATMGFGVTMAHDRISQRRHMNSDLLLYVHSGVARITIDNKEYTAATGDLVFVPRGTIYYADCLSKRQLELLTLYSPPLDPADIEFLEPTERVALDTTRKPKIPTKVSVLPDSLRGRGVSDDDEFFNMQDYQAIDEEEGTGK